MPEEILYPQTDYVLQNSTQISLPETIITSATADYTRGHNLPFSRINPYKYMQFLSCSNDLEYYVPIWSSYLVRDIEVLEKVQMQATKLIKGYEKLPHDHRLKSLGIHTLFCRRQ